MAAIATQFGEEMTMVRPVETIQTKRVAQFFFATFWTLVFTGSIRKWIFPGVSAFYLLQDVPITLAYLYAAFNGMFSRGYLFFITLLISAVVFLQAMLQLIALGISPVIVVVGIHHYLYYLPMLLIFPLGLTPKYRRNFIRWNLWLTLPMGVLCVAQAMAPNTAWVNRTSEGDAMSLPGSDIARICGTYNFGVFFGIWLSLALALCLGEWLLPYHQRVIRNRLLLPISTFTLVLIALASASRQNILLCAAAACGAFLAAALIRSIRVIAVLAIFILSLPLIAGLTYIISPSEFNIVHDRFTGSAGQRDIKNRLGENVYGWLTEPEVSLIGKGVGLGVDAAHIGSVDAYNFTYELSELDSIRNVMELGTPVGLLYVALRYVLSIGMILLACRLVRASPHTLPIACVMFGQVLADLTRAATMTATQVMIGYSFILGVYLYPYDEPEPALHESEPRTVLAAGTVA